MSRWTITIRRAVFDDKEHLARFRCSWPRRAYTKTAQKVVRALPPYIESGEVRCLLAFHLGALVGVLAWRLDETTNAPFLVIVAVTDQPEYRRRGIGTALVTHLVGELRTQGFIGLDADADASNKPGMGLLVRQGAAWVRDPDDPDFVLLHLAF